MPLREGIEISEEDANKYDELMKQYAYFNNRQHCQKILLNSVYGCISNQNFRFNNGLQELGESVTAGGRLIVTHQHRKTNELLTGEYDEFGEAIVAGDTDSSYFKTFADNVEDAVETADCIADEVNKSFNPFVKETFLVKDKFLNIISAGREIVGENSIFVAKKKYMIYVVDNEGIPCSFTKTMGLDFKRTTIPKTISNKLEKYIERLLKGEHWDDIELDIVAYKDKLLESNSILDIGIPSGVNKIEEYTRAYRLDPTTYLPGTVGPCIFYNICREKFNDNESPELTSGMKTKKFFLKKKEGRFGTISLPTDMTEYEIPKWFHEFEIDKDTHMDRLVDSPINNVIKALGKESPTKQSIHLKNLFEF